MLLGPGYEADCTGSSISGAASTAVSVKCQVRSVKDAGGHEKPIEP